MTKKLLVSFFVLIFSVFLPKGLKAQMTVNSSVTAAQLAQALVGTGVQVSNAVLNCGTGGFGLFNVTGGNLGMQSGIILTNGSAVNAIGPNSLPSISTNFTPALPGDPDLNAILFPTTTADACSIEFDVFVSSDTLSFNYVFGSDEYPEFVSFWPVINDLFGLFISGPGIVGKQNIALVPNTSTYVGINTVNCTVNGAQYVCNTPAGTAFGGICATNCPTSFAGTITEYDGFTKKLTAKKAVQRCNTYHLKIVIADGNDDVVDSGLFLEAASLSTSGVNVIASVDTTVGGISYPNMVEACKNGSFCFIRAGLNTDTSVVKFLIQGSAINGVDYNHIADSLVFYPGDTAFCVPIIPVSDGLNEGLESVIIRVIYTSCSGTSYLGDSLILSIQDPVQIQLPADTIICTNPFSVTAQSAGTLPPPTLTCGSNTVSSLGPAINYSVGIGNNQSALPSFLNGYYHDSRVLLVFSRNDLVNAGAAAGIIQNLAFNVTQYNSSYPYQNFSIKIGCANSANPSLPIGFVAGLTQVYGPSNFTPSAGWNTINLSQAFDWDGVNGIYVEICYDNAVSSNSDVLQKSLTTLPSVLYAYKDSTVGCSMNFSAPNTIGSSSLRPNLRFGIANPAPVPFSYNWSPSNILLSGSNSNTVTVNLTQPTFLTCTINSIPGCAVSDTMLLNYVNAAALTISSDTTICPNIPLALTASGGLSYNWYSLNGGSLSCSSCSNPSVLINVGGISDSFIVVASMQGGCILRDTVMIRTINAPIPSVQINSPVCINTPTQVTFTGNAGSTASFNWNFGSANFTNLGTSNVGPYNVSWSNAGTYFVGLQITDSGCSASLSPTSVNVLNNLPANIVLSDDTICQGNTIQVQETNNLSGATYNWNFGGGSVLSGNYAGPYVVSYLASDSITVQITANGCNSIPVKKYLFVKPLPVASFSLSGNNICSNQSDTIQFNGTLNTNAGLATYQWDFGNAAVTTIAPNTDYILNWNNSSNINVVDTIGLTLIQQGCTSTNFFKRIIIHPIPKAIIGLVDDTICENFNTTAHAFSSVVNPLGGPKTYNWNWGGLSYSPNTSSIGPYLISPGSLINYDSITNVLITLEITQDACKSKADSMFFVIKPQPQASFSMSDTNLCSGTVLNVVFNGLVNSYNGTNPVYNWNFNGASTLMGSGVGPYNVIYLNADSIAHTFIPVLFINQDGCSSNVFADTLTLLPHYDFDILATPNFCIGQNGYLYSSYPFENYQWSTGSTYDSILVQISGNYTLIVTDKNGCVDSSTYSLNIKYGPHANAGQDFQIYSGNYVQIDGSSSYGGNSFYWSPNVNMSLNNIASPYVAPTVTTQYILSYSDTTIGCVDHDTMTIFVLNCGELIIPNAFSPNEDGTDDYFMIMNPDAIYKLDKFLIYNRWGQKVFETDDKLSKGWDGKFCGKEQEIGSYVYLIVAECGGGKQFKLKGNLTLIR